jgi:uncharacterized protein
VSVARKAAFLLDRTAVLFVGLALGGVITFSFFVSGEPTAASGTGALPAPAVPTQQGQGQRQGPAPLPAAAAEFPAAPGPRLVQAVAEGRRIHVGVFGDSFGDGVWAGLYNQLPTDTEYAVHQFSHQATGFTRYRSTNLLDDTRAKLDRQPVDIAVLSFGANDTQGIFLNGEGAEYMSPRWQEIVTERLTAIVTLLRQRGVTVYWVGLPRMREAAYDADIRRMNAFYQERMRALDIPFIDTFASTADAGGGYAPYLTDPRSGERINARTNDGVHMTIPGYQIVTRGLVEMIRRSVADARRLGGRATQASANGGASNPG